MAPPFRRVVGKGKSYKWTEGPKKGEFVKYADVQEYYSQVSPEVRQALYNQRIQESKIRHLQNPENEGVPLLYRAPPYDEERDRRLHEFAETPRAKRTSEQWEQWRDDMTAIYGEDRNDWGEYD